MITPWNEGDPTQMILEGQVNDEEEETVIRAVPSVKAAQVSEGSLQARSKTNIASLTKLATVESGPHRVVA